MPTDYFSKLSDEIVLSVFRWLPKKSLKRCALVCRRWRDITYDEELWTRMDLGGRTLIPGNLADVMKRGVRILRLAQADVSTIYVDHSSRCSFFSGTCALKVLFL